MSASTCRRAQLGRDAARALGIAADHDHVGAARVQLAGGDAADAGARAREDDREDVERPGHR
jgi:hypothetical protein